VAQDHILLVSALRQLALTFDYLGYPDKVLQSYQQTFPYLNDMPSLLRSCIYAGISGAHAQLHHKQEADHFLHLAYEHFPEKDEEGLSFLHITCRYSSLIFWEGLNHLVFNQPAEAEKVFAHIDGLHPKIVLAEKARAELLNYQAETFTAMRSMEQACTYLEAAVNAAINIGSKIRFQESMDVFGQVWRLWHNEMCVQALVDLFFQASRELSVR
jgi:tetratricopeptide (TPR) repeat protein